MRIESNDSRPMKNLPIMTPEAPEDRTEKEMRHAAPRKVLLKQLEYPALFVKMSKRTLAATKPSMKN